MRNQTTTSTYTLDTLVRRAPATDDLRELAAWLGENDASHFSQIERIELPLDDQGVRHVRRRHLLYVRTGRRAEQNDGAIRHVAPDRTNFPSLVAC
ncbi:MAG: hypothetical protein OHK0015_06130 [Chloroflexi bacterium OHK40]